MIIPGARHLCCAYADPELYEEKMMEKNEIFERLTGVFRDVFDDETILLNEDTSPDDIDGWDSLAHISLIAAVESEFGIRFDIKTAMKMKTAGEMAAAVAEILG